MGPAWAGAGRGSSATEALGESAGKLALSPLLPTAAAAVGAAAGRRRAAAREAAATDLCARFGGRGGQHSNTHKM